MNQFVAEQKSEIVSSSGQCQSVQNSPQINITEWLTNNAQIQGKENNYKECESNFQQKIAFFNGKHRK